MPTKKESSTDWAMILAGIVSVGVLGGLAYLFTRDNESRLDQDEQFAPDQTRGSNIDSQEAATRANLAFTAMDMGGTDEVGLLLSLEGVNIAGLNLIYNKFGKRSGTFAFIPQNLYQWFRSDLSGSDLQDVRNLWASQGATPPF